MRLSDVITHLRSIASENLAEQWDKVGLQLGDPDWRLKKGARGLLCIDLTEDVMAEAISKKSSLIVAYHPPIFQPLNALTTRDWKQRIILHAAQKKIAIYSPHTALDAARGGVNDWLCGGIGKGEIHVIDSRQLESDQYKIVTFVPADHVGKVRRAMAERGAGEIGNYVECSFSGTGQGTFLGTEGANPYVGQAGQLESTDELRMEMVCPEWFLAEVIAAMKHVHPYEEPAFDIYKLVSPPPAPDHEAGQGRVVDLAKPVTLKTLVSRVKRHLGMKRLKVAAPADFDGQISSVSLCAGAGVTVVTQAAHADAYFTGEMRHHDVLDAVQQGKVVILAGHTNTERPYLPVYKRRLSDLTGDQVEWTIATNDRAPCDIV